MSILDPSYNCDLHFSDLAFVYSRCWNEAFFELSKLSKIQLESQAIDGTFEGIWDELLAEFASETHTRFDNMANILYKAIAPYLKQDPVHGTRPVHIYMPDCFERNDGDLVFRIWDDLQRECVFEMRFSIKNS